MTEPTIIGVSMSLERFDKGLQQDLVTLHEAGRSKAPERIITDYIPASQECGPRYKLQGYQQQFIRMNSNSYLSLSHHPDVKKAADVATHHFGVGPGAVRFIDGTFSAHVELEERIAAFCGRPFSPCFAQANLLTRSFVAANRKAHSCAVRIGVTTEHLRNL